MSTYRDVDLLFYRLGVVDGKHPYLPSRQDERVHRGWWTADFMVVAVSKKRRVVGTLRANAVNRTNYMLSANGSWVSASWRRRGLATRMWRYLLRKTNASVVRVQVISDRGMTLMTALKKHIPRVRFEIYDAGDRKLRDLRKAKNGKV